MIETTFTYTQLNLDTNRRCKRADVSVPLKDLSEKHGFDLIVDGVVKFEAKEKRVTLKSGKVLDDFDYIVVAIGQDKIQMKGMENTLSICGKPEEADELHSRLMKLVDRGSGKDCSRFWWKSKR